MKRDKGEPEDRARETKRDEDKLADLAHEIRVSMSYAVMAFKEQVAKGVEAGEAFRAYRDRGGDPAGLGVPEDDQEAAILIAEAFADYKKFPDGKWQAIHDRVLALTVDWMIVLNPTMSGRKKERAAGKLRRASKAEAVYAFQWLKHGMTNKETE